MMYRTRTWSQGDHSGKPITKSQGEGVRAWVDTDIAYTRYLH